MRTIDLTVIGDLNLDVLLEVPRFPALDDEIEVISRRQMPGGDAANIAAAAARLGLNPVLIARAGVDPDGQALVTTLKDTGVDTGYLQWDLDQPTGWSIAMVRPDGQRNLLSFRGANRGLHLGERQIAAISASRWVHLSDPPPWMVGEVAGVLPPGTRLSLDPGGITAARGIPPLKSILNKTAILFCNQAELATLTGIQDRGAAIRALLNEGPETVVVKLGPQGCQVQTTSACLHVPGFSVQAIDSTGAGDTFDAAFITAVLSELPFADAARFANAAGALATLGIGAQSAQPTREQLDTFLNTSKDVNA